MFVALLAEGVDRNRGGRNYITQKGWQVALLTEGVDRNTPRSTIWLNTPASPSSRRAWIEITFTAYEIYQQPVALLTEGVDRNALPQLTAYSALHPSIVNLSPIGLIVRGAKQKQKAA